MRGRLSRRDQLLQNNAADRFYAAAAGVEPQFQNAIPAKRIRRPVDGRPPGLTEHQVQAAIITWWALAHRQYGVPEFALLAVPSGGARDVVTGSLLKAEGVRRGVPDLLLAKPVGPYSGFWLELKVGYNKPTPEQTTFIEYLLANGYSAGVYWDSASAIAAIENYLRDEKAAS